VHSGASGARNIDTLFFMLGWDRFGFNKNRVRTHYVELVFLYPVGAAAPIAHSVSSGARNVDALFFMLRWERYGFQKKRVGTCYTELVFLHLGRYLGGVVHSGASGVRNISARFFCSGGSSALSIKSAGGHVTTNLCFCIRWDLQIT
jgi:hypothetical protein